MVKADLLMDALGLIDDETVRTAKIRAQKAKHLSFRRRIALAAAVVVCLMLAVPALAAAADTEPVYSVLYAISPVIAQKLKPVRMSCEDNGIRMEVISAYVHEDSADIYISMQDLTGDRIDGTTDLFDSYSINRSFSSSAICQLVSYDAAQKTATFLIHITQWGKKDITGDKVTFSVKEFLSHKYEFEGILPQLDLASMPQSPATQTSRQIRGYSSPNRLDEEAILLLVPQSGGLFSPVPGVQITAAGYVDGKLHIQAYYENISETDNHGYLYLVDANGTKINSSLSVSFWDDAHSGSYGEDIFDVPADGLTGYQVYGQFWTCDTLTKGNWQVTFPLEKE